MSLLSGNVAQRHSVVVSGKKVRRRPGKYAFDIVFSLCALIFLLPALALIALGLLFINGRPIIYKHERIGADGRPFNCLKFRTMRKDADKVLAELLAIDPQKREEWERTQKLTADPRVHSLGRYLRMTSLDELPQLINVLRGEMSIVGPRPIVADEMSRYGPHINCYIGTKPGITGLWQVSRHKGMSYEERVQLDVYQYQNSTFLSDLIIIWRTIGVVLFASNER